MKKYLSIIICLLCFCKGYSQTTEGLQCTGRFTGIEFCYNGNSYFWVKSYDEAQNNDNDSLFIHKLFNGHIADSLIYEGKTYYVRSIKLICNGEYPQGDAFPGYYMDECIDTLWIGKHAHYIDVSSKGSLLHYNKLYDDGYYVDHFGDGRSIKFTDYVVDPENPYLSSKDGLLFDKSGTNLIARPWSKDDDIRYDSNGIGTLYIPDEVQSINDNVYYYSEFYKNPQKIHFPDSLKSIGKSAFQSLTWIPDTLLLPSGIKSIDERAFCDTGVKSVKLPEGLEYLGMAPFNYTDVHYLEYPSTLKTVQALDKYDNKEPSTPLYIFRIFAKEPPTVYCDKRPVSEYAWNEWYIDRHYYEAILYVPIGCKELYTSARGWNTFAYIEEIADDEPTPSLADAIMPVKAESSIRITSDKGKIAIIGIGEKQNVGIYSMDGRLISTLTADKNTCNLPVGTIVLIKREDKTVKKLVR